MQLNKTKIITLSIGLLIIIAILFLFSVQVYDNKNNISSNSPLYKVDILNEKISLFFSRSKLRIDLCLRFMNERALEVKKVSKQKEIDKILKAFDYLYNRSQKELSKINNDDQKISYQKNIIGSLFSLLEQLSQSSDETPEKVIENISLSLNSLSDEEKTNVIKENSDKIKVISKNSNELLSKIKDKLPNNIAEDFDSIIKEDGDEETEDTEDPEVPQELALPKMSTETAFSLTQEEIKEQTNIETINVIASKSIFSVGALIDKRNPAYEEANEDNLSIIFRYSKGEYIKIGTYYTDAIDADKTIGARSEIKALSLTADELKWLIFSQKENQIINYY